MRNRSESLGKSRLRRAQRAGFLRFKVPISCLSRYFWLWIIQFIPVALAAAAMPTRCSCGGCGGCDNPVPKAGAMCGKCTGRDTGKRAIGAAAADGHCHKPRRKSSFSIGFIRFCIVPTGNYISVVPLFAFDVCLQSGAWCQTFRLFGIVRLGECEIPPEHRIYTICFRIT